MVIRIVGLSATLPNYIDVADFLWYAIHSVYPLSTSLTQVCAACLTELGCSTLTRPSALFPWNSILSGCGANRTVLYRGRTLIRSHSTKSPSSFTKGTKSWCSSTRGRRRSRQRRRSKKPRWWRVCWTSSVARNTHHGRCLGEISLSRGTRR